MAKKCTPDPNIDVNCKPYAGGQCEGVQYRMNWTWNLVVTGSGTNDGTFPQELNTGVINTGFSNTWIRGKLGCISEPVSSQQGTVFGHFLTTKDLNGNNVSRYFEIAASSSIPSFGILRLVQDIKFNGVFRIDLLADNCGDFNPYEDVCVCDDTDEQITCLDAVGKICCIPKSKINQLCNRV